MTTRTSLLSRLLVAALSSGLLAACATTEQTPETPTPAQAAQASANATAASSASATATAAAAPASFLCTGQIPSDLSTADAYAAAIQQKICVLIKVPKGVTGDPYAEFTVKQRTDGRVTDVRLKRSSGNKALDKAIHNAIRKASPLPRPSKAELFNPALELKFYPLRGQSSSTR